MQPYHSFEDTEFDFPTADDLHAIEKSSRKRRKPSVVMPDRRRQSRITRPPRSEADQAFKCGHCKQFIGAPLTGGRHRNHCPNCLFSRHVDLNHPGDRRSDCHALMEPVGVVSRRNSEQVIVHRCLRCGKEDANRIAADDNPILLMTLPPVSPAGLALVPDADLTDSEEEMA